jgi:protocatechuate 3,4-dioxygenase beta subunit
MTIRRERPSTGPHRWVDESRVPLTIKLTVRDAASGDAAEGAGVYLWHCDRDGNYVGADRQDLPDRPGQGGLRVGRRHLRLRAERVANALTIGV